MSNPFKVGDMVQVFGPASLKPDQTYYGGWVRSMETAVGSVQRVQRLEGSKGAFLDGHTYVFDVRCMKLAAPIKAAATEKDPSGIDQHTPGAKLDAGKLRPALVLNGFANALEAVVEVGTDGAAKYTDNGWKEVANGFARYEDAEGRHRLKRGKGETHDKDSGSLHLAHEAWNALAKLELYLKDNA